MDRQSALPEDLTDQRSVPAPSTLRADGVATACALVLLIGVLAVQLDRSAFTEGEALTAATALSPLDHEFRVPVGGPAHAMIRGFGVTVTTTERGLRLLVVLGSLLAALIIGEGAARLGTARARPICYLLFAAHPCIARTDVLYPGLLGLLPVALVIGAAVFLRGGPWWWCVGGWLGAAGAALLDARVQTVAVGAVVVLPLIMGSAATTRRVAFAVGGVCSAVIAWWSAGMPFDAGSAWNQSAGEPGVLAALGWGGATVVGSSLLFVIAAIGVLLDDRDALVRIAVTVLILAVVVCIPLLAGLGWIDGSGSAAIVPALVFALAMELSRRPRAAFGFIAVATLVAILGSLPQVLQRLSANPVQPSAMTEVLDRARKHGAPGGRLILWGADRHALLYYLRRGHDPAMPVLLADEDIPLDQVGDLLRSQLRAERGREHLLPPVLIHPRPKNAPPGLAFVDMPWADDTLAILRLKGG